ncbi:MAG: hypothetical protein Q7T49_03055 [bacterium]|nr:hypothetical protein [bacterium]
MKKLIYTLVFSLLILPSVVSAAQIKTGDQFILPPSEQSLGNVYVGAGSASVLGQVVGDLYVGAGTTVVSGQVTDDVVIAGGNTTITGNVGGDVRVLGGQVLITGRVGGDVLVVGGSLNLSGEVGGDLDFIGGMLTVADGARVAGNLTYRSDRKADIGPNAYIGGQITYDKSIAEKLGVLKNSADSKSFKTTILALFGAWLFLKLMMFIFAGLVIFWLLAEPVEKVIKTSFHHPWRSLITGFAALVAVPVLAVILLVTVIGLPLAFFIGLVYLVLLLSAKLAAGLVLGAWLDWQVMKRASYKLTWQNVLLGIIVFFALSYVPLVGWLLDLAIIVLVFGAILDLIYRRWRQ